MIFLESEIIMVMVDEEKATLQEVCDYALRVHSKGFNVLPMRADEKAPLFAWKDKNYGNVRQSADTVRSFDWTQNIGIINGIGGLRTIDIDGCEDFGFVFKVLELLGIDNDYDWYVFTPGKGGGIHIYIRCEDDLTLTDKGVLVGDPIEKNTFNQVELRWKNCLTMFPPSIHPDEKEPYKWKTNTMPETSIATVSIELVEKVFLAIATIKKEAPPTIVESHPAIPTVPTVKFDAWAQRALNQEVAILQATTSNRNNQLNKSSFNLGQIIGSGMLLAETVEAALTHVAISIGLDEKEIAPTIKSGIEAGEKKPRMPKQVFRANEPTTLPPSIHPGDEALANFSYDDRGNAEAVWACYGHHIAYNGSYDWMIWNGTHFVPSIQRINTIIVDVLRRRQRAAAHMERPELAKVSKSMAGNVAACKSMLEDLAYVPVEDFDSEPDLINCQNGIVNMRTKKLLSSDPIYRFTWCANAAYKPLPELDCTLWKLFLQETLGSESMIHYLQQFLGYSITGHISEECLAYIFGPPRSGKGTLSETLMALFPYPICMEVDFNTFTQKRDAESQNFDLAPMKPARLVFASESNKYQSLNPAKVKALTGGNMVTCAFKYGQTFSYQPQYTVWLSSNHEVNGDPDDDALWSRLRVIPFPNSRLGKEDKSLKSKMQSTDNLEIVLSWLVDGAYEWYQTDQHGLKIPEDVTALTLKHREAQDSVGIWLDECCERVEDGWVENTQVMTSYKTWCEANNYEAKKAKSLSQSLAAHGMKVGVFKRLTDISGEQKSARGIQGIRLLV